MQRTIGGLVVKAVKVAVENSPPVRNNGGGTNVRSIAISDEKRSSGMGSARDLSAKDMTRQSLAVLRAQAKRRKMAQERRDAQNERI